MKTNLIIDTIGYTAKKERVTNVNFKHFDNTLVLENATTLKNYYSAFQMNNEHDDSKTIFFITSEQYPLDFVTKITRKVRKDFRQNFDAAPGEIEVLGEKFNCIRIYDFNLKESVLDLQDCYGEKGIEYKYSDKRIDEEAIIKIKKQYLLSNLDKGVYQDIIFPERYYIEMKEKLGWREFEEATEYVKGNFKEAEFDAAICSISNKGNNLETARIFFQQTQPTQILSKIKNEYDSYIRLNF